MNRALAVALAVTALLATGCPAPAKDSCTTPSIKCGDRCLDGSSDAANCGTCGHACATGESCCGGTCIDVNGSDATNCGACGHRCPSSGVCTTGACSCPGTLPTQCGSTPGACVDLTLDPTNCGTCGERCAGIGVADPEAICTSSSCVCAGPPTSTDCGGNPRCVNTNVDERNCGDCGAVGPAHVCKTNAVCAGGVCGCTNAAFPDSCPTACVNVQTDGLNCGSCGHACTGTTPSCSKGLCCPSGQTSCSGACVDTRTSTANCGSCGNACAAGQTCSGGSCVCPGATPLTCGPACCAGSSCCPGDTCQPPHSNGLGGTFLFGCSANPALSRALAVAAADSWRQGGSTLDLFCSGNCLARQADTQCAVWCYDGNFAGHVTSGGLACAALCTNFIGGGTPTWP